jgi:pimeloyl-ACP methyl ester carboxylesterase
MSRRLAFAFLMTAASTIATSQEPTTHLIQVGRGVRLEVLQWSSAQTRDVPILLLHGAGNNADHWRDFAPLLANNRRVIALSRRGAGGSTVAAKGITIDTLVRDIVTVLDSLRVPQVVALGHSYAGRELTALGRRHAGRLKGIVYFDAAYTAKGKSVIPTLEPIFATFGEGSPPLVEPTNVETSIKFFQGFGCTYSPAAVRKMFSFDATGRLVSQRYDSASHVYLEEVVEPASYAGYRGPVLALRARWPLPGTPHAVNNNTRLTPKIQQVMAILDTVWMDLRRDLPQAQYVEIPDAMHCVFASQPRAASAAVLHFVDRVR